MTFHKEYTKDVINSRLLNEFNAGCNVLKNKLLYNNSAPRDLLTLCREEYNRQQEDSQFNTGFALVLNGNVVCRYGIDKKVECPYQDNEKDHSGLYQCNNPDIINEYKNVLKLANAEYKRTQ